MKKKKIKFLSHDKNKSNNENSSEIKQEKIDEKKIATS